MLGKKFRKNMFSDSDSILVWEQGYVSTDVAEDNDDSSDSSSSSATDRVGEGSDEEEYYDEEGEEEEPDIDEIIE